MLLSVRDGAGALGGPPKAEPGAGSAGRGAAGAALFGPPKSEAGQRTVALPVALKGELTRHLAGFSAVADDALVFTSPNGSPLRHANFRQRVWLPALEKAGLTGTHFHDLRHTGNDLTAGTGASLRELMDRMGHSSARVALIYLHGSDARQREIAASLSKVVQRELKGGNSGRPEGSARKASGTQRARKASRAS